jgi:hypothetical protein
MNRDLQKAERALADGRRAEASVYAWNALADVQGVEATRLARIARELDDQLLLRELESRGFLTEPPAESPAQPDRKSFARRLLGAWPLLVVGLIVLGAVVFNALGEPGPVEPSSSDAVVQPPSGHLPIVTEAAGVWLTPVGRLKTVDVQKLADDLTFRYRIPIGTLPQVQLPPWTLDSDRHQLVADSLLVLLSRYYGAEGNATIIGITDFDMRSNRAGVKGHAFALGAEAHYGVISTAQLGGNVIDLWRGHTRYQRTRKLVARYVGFLFLHRAEVDDPHSLLRPKMSSAGDIDALIEKL